MLDHI